MFKKILVATDGSSHAQSAVALAGDLAEKYQAEVIVLHVLQRQVSEPLRHMAEVEYQTSLNSQAHDSDAAVFEALLDIGRRILDRAAQHLKDNGVSAVRTINEEGEAAQQIIRAADREEVDAVVLGSRGLSDLKGLLMGSVSHKVGQLAHCTCITVK